MALANRGPVAVELLLSLSLPLGELFEQGDGL
jgi:hypothetical protein